MWKVTYEVGYVTKTVDFHASCFHDASGSALYAIKLANGDNERDVEIIKLEEVR